jgi:hypothetical protein
VRNDGWSGVEDPEKRNLPDLITQTALFLDHGEGNYYAIADEIEIVEAGRIGVISLDCVSVGHFWSVLGARRNRELFQVLENFHNAATPVEVRNRRELLRALLRVETEDLLEWIRSRCAVLLFFHPDRLNAVAQQLPPGEWRRIHITPYGEPSMLTVPKSADEIVTVATRDLHDDEAVAVTVDWVDDVTPMERNYLAEIFSLNHLPDLPLDGGTTPVIPSPAAPIILSNGGFSIDGDRDFWEGRGEQSIRVMDEQISPYPYPGKAFCRPTKTEFDVTCNNKWGGDCECTVVLRNRDGHAFVISIEGEQLIATIDRHKEVHSLYGKQKYAQTPMVQSMR